MRYYASWIARFISVDPLQFDYPHYTPFQYAGNKPISYIDLDGAEENDKVNQNIPRRKARNNNTGNLIIFVSDDITKEFIDENLLEREDGNSWDYIYVKNIREAAYWVDKGYGDINELVIRIHGSGGEDEIVGAEISDDPQKNDYVLSYRILEGILSGDYENHINTKHVKSFQKIGKHLTRNANVLVSACHIGSCEDYSRLFYEMIAGEKEINLYLNADISNVGGVINEGKPDEKFGVITDKDITSEEIPEKDRVGWFKVTKDDIRKVKGIMKLSKSGKIIDPERISPIKAKKIQEQKRRARAINIY